MVNLDEDEFRTYCGPDCETIDRAGGAVLVGAHGRATAIDTAEQRRLVAVEFKPGGAAAFLRMPMSETRDRMVDLEEVWGRDGRLLRDRLCEAPTPTARLRTLETALLERITSTRDPQISYAVTLLESGVSIAEAGMRLGLLPKTFVRRFRHRVGLSPKRFARVRRLQHIVGSVAGRANVDWCTLAAEHGYTDQAHLIHDFRDLAGMTPAAYRPSSPQRRNHVPLAPILS
jgi:AraC-like DNA-binding protein